jgi:hypothetical protein
VVGSCDHGNEHLGSMNGRIFPRQMNNCQCLKKERVAPSSTGSI